MQNVTEYYASGEARLFISAAYLLALLLLSGVFFSSHRAFSVAKQTLGKLKNLD